ncbi:MAG: MarR family transcriptional regulator [Pseudolysinimonas sp.]
MPTSGAPEPRDGARAPTRMLRELLQVSHDFEHHLARTLSVNSTDLTAMEQLIQDGPLAPGELARRLGITPPAVTAVVDRLAAVGHVTRSSNEADRRGVVVTASKNSTMQAMAVLLPMIREVDATLDGFTTAEQAVISVYLDRVLAAYRNHIPGDQPSAE